MKQKLECFRFNFKTITFKKIRAEKKKLKSLYKKRKKKKHVSVTLTEFVAKLRHVCSSVFQGEGKGVDNMKKK